MKRTYLFLLIILYYGLAVKAQSGSIGIGTTNPNSSAALETPYCGNMISLPPTIPH